MKPISVIMTILLVNLTIMIELNWTETMDNHTTMPMIWIHWSGCINSGQCYSECRLSGKQSGQCRTCDCDTCGHFKIMRCICDRFIIPWSVYNDPEMDPGLFVCFLL